jgi:phage FluMu protein Com
VSQSLQEFRCPDCNKLLCKVGGKDVVVEAWCKNCKEPRTFVFPHPLAHKAVAAGGK